MFRGGRPLLRRFNRGDIITVSVHECPGRTDDCMEARHESIGFIARGNSVASVLKNSADEMYRRSGVRLVIKDGKTGKTHG